MKEALKKVGNDQVNVHKVLKSGHHIYLDNVPEFNELFKKELSNLPASD